jgi:hypothetical protein
MQIAIESSAVQATSFFAYLQLGNFGWRYSGRDLCRPRRSGTADVPRRIRSRTETLGTSWKKLAWYDQGLPGFPFEAVLIVSEGARRLDLLAREWRRKGLELGVLASTLAYWGRWQGNGTQAARILLLSVKSESPSGSRMPLGLDAERSKRLIALRFTKGRPSCIRSILEQLEGCLAIGIDIPSALLELSLARCLVRPERSLKTHRWNTSDIDEESCCNAGQNLKTHECFGRLVDLVDAGRSRADCPGTDHPGRRQPCARHSTPFAPRNL